MKLLENKLLVRTIQYKFPRCKSKRIAKKWKKNKKNYKLVPDEESVYITPFGMMCHPNMAKRLKEELQLLGDPVLNIPLFT